LRRPYRRLHDTQPEAVIDSVEPTGFMGRPDSRHVASRPLIRLSSRSGAFPAPDFLSPHAATFAHSSPPMPATPISENASLTPLPGHLYVVATPIGNLADISERGRAILGAVDLVACEDTRTTGTLLTRFGLHKELVAYHEHNETDAALRLADQIAAGKSVAVVSDAGTPALSDPGFRIVRECRRRGLPVVPVPGASALTAVLSASGLPTNGFLFVGFLPPKTAARTGFFERYRDFEYTLVLYESCHRIDKAVAEIVTTLGEQRVICVAKEVTKLHETFLVGTAAEVAARLAKTALKGEFVLLIAPADYVL
jgi:16S rRNA (cytidine1402-2'-O)-methyltransferase